MKNIILVVVLIAIASCSAQKKEQKPALKDEEGNLSGITHKKDFLQEPYLDWFSSNYDEYKIDAEIFKQLTPHLKDVSIKAFMGTWCEDSQLQTPVFYKILDQANFDFKNLELITVDREKTTPNNLQEGFNIEYVPTFIFYKNGKELGRFVEYPIESVEADILKIVSGEKYIPAYQEEE
jgi:thiol-disulfide isomerase/thioredoxin